jgi:hypothetical protein
MADGFWRASATNVVTRNGPDAITRQSKDRTLDGEALPDPKQITMKRVRGRSLSSPFLVDPDKIIPGE